MTQRSLQANHRTARDAIEIPNETGTAKRGLELDEFKRQFKTIAGQWKAALAIHKRTRIDCVFCIVPDAFTGRILL